MMDSGQLHVSPPMPTGGYGGLRRWVRVWLRQHPVADVDNDEVALVLTELVSNSMRHGTGVVDIDLTGDANILLLSVGDTSDLLPLPRAPGSEDVGGRGLGLVAGLSHCWGVRRRPEGGKIVWCQFSSLPGRWEPP
jgi:anti-sigma regulatory factor (Ser/Thr protein kinase)